MATHNYTITFRSLRAGTFYTVNIGGGTGTAIALKGGAEPFVTQEDTSEDSFMPLRTQSGYIRIVDDGKDAEGQALGADWWKDLLAMTNTERPVTLVARPAADAAGTTVWQGFMQSQNFGGELYEAVQEREFPVQCVISSLEGVSLPSDLTGRKNFGWLISTLVESTGAGFTDYYVQGGVDAREWLRTQADCRNFLHTVEGALVPRYDAQEVLTDICKYWGWTLRTDGTSVILACMDDELDRQWLYLTSSQMADVGSSSGELVTCGSYGIGVNFVNTNNETMLIRGIKRAAVQVDVNVDSTPFKFAPSDLEDEMGEPSTWVQQPDEDMVGYFKSQPTKVYLEGQTMTAMVNSGNTSTGGLERRIIYSETESSGTTVDAMLIRADYSTVGSTGVTIISLDSRVALAYGGGSFGIKATLYNGAKQLNITDKDAGMRARLGIGMSRESETTKWFYLYSPNGALFELVSGWGNEPSEFLLNVEGNRINGVKVENYPTDPPLFGARYRTYANIPVADGLYGYIFVDILGSAGFNQPFEIADFEIEYTKDKTVLPDFADEVRGRTIRKELATEKTYSADNSSTVEEKWNADCIFATDNGLEYGYGMLMKADGDWLEMVQYAGNSSNLQHPEQHLANRVVYFGRKSREMLSVELQNEAFDIAHQLQLHLSKIAGGTYYAQAVGYDWRDDVRKILFVETD